MKSFPYIIILIIFYIAGCQAHSENKNEGQNEVVNFPVVQLKTHSATIPTEYVSEIEAIKNVEIRVRVSGYLDQIYVDEGQEVKKGQLMFKISDQEYKAELASANASLKSALAEEKIVKLEVRKIKSLVEKNILSSAELEVAKAKLETLNAKVEEALSAKQNAELKLSFASISAPFDGVIDRIPFKTGSLVNEGVLLTTVSAINFVYAYFNVSEGEYLEYIKSMLNGDERNEVVSLILADGSEYAHQGKIETIESEFEQGTGAIAFRARFPNPDKILKHRATGKVLLTKVYENALLVPQKATFEIQDKNYVVVVDSHNLTHLRSFVPHKRYQNFYIVESGLKKDEIILFEGAQGMKAGARLQTKMISMDSLMMAL